MNRGGGSNNWCSSAITWCMSALPALLHLYTFRSSSFHIPHSLFQKFHLSSNTISLFPLDKSGKSAENDTEFCICVFQGGRE